MKKINSRLFENNFLNEAIALCKGGLSNTNCESDTVLSNGKNNDINYKTCKGGIEYNDIDTTNNDDDNPNCGLSFQGSGGNFSINSNNNL